jgi:hypothetical protein
MYVLLLVPGVQVMADDMGGYGSLGCQVLELLQDTYAKTPVLYYSLRRSSSGAPTDTMGRARCVWWGWDWVSSEVVAGSWCQGGT